jgi:hypothetical protein
MVQVASEVWETKGQDERPQIKGFQGFQAAHEAVFPEFGQTWGIQNKKTNPGISSWNIELPSCQ